MRVEGLMDLFYWAFSVLRGITKKETTRGKTLIEKAVTRGYGEVEDEKAYSYNSNNSPIRLKKRKEEDDYEKDYHLTLIASRII